MKTQLFAAAAAAVLLTAGVAQAETAGYVGANYGRANLEVDSLGDTDVDVFQGEGAVAFDAGQFGVQLDGSFTNFDADGGDDTLFSGTAHLNKRFDAALVGGFAGVSVTDDVTLWGVGGEAQFDLAPSTTIYGQVGYGQSDDLGEADLWAGRGELRHYFTDTFKVAGSAGFTNLESDAAELDIWNVGVDAEYQFAGTGWSVIGGYEHGEIDDVDLSSDTFRVGFRYTFGGTLRERDQSAGLGRVDTLFGSTLGQSLVTAVGAID